MWRLPKEVSEQELAAISATVLDRPDVPFKVRDEEFRIECAGLGWDIFGRTYEPERSQLTEAPDGRKVGAFLLHGGAGDHREMDNLASLLAGKFGVKVATVTYPGHWYWDSETHEWPGKPRDDGTGHPRVPLWDRQNPIGHDEYDLVTFNSDPEIRANRGTSFLLAAKPGTQFYHRQAAWPMAYEEAFLAVCERNFPDDEYALYLHGHSTGGPFTHMMLQRKKNVAGLIGMETSIFGSIKKKMDAPGAGGERFPFNYLTLRTWRDEARYMGAQAPDGMARRHLALLMEQVFENWERETGRAGFKVEHFVQFAGLDALTGAANALADILAYDDDARAQLVSRYLGYTKPLDGPDAPPLPPLLYIINEHSRDHRLDNYNGVLLPELAKLEPAPKANVVFFSGGVHDYNLATPELPRGVAAVGVKVWIDAIMNGYFA